MLRTWLRASCVPTTKKSRLLLWRWNDMLAADRYESGSNRLELRQERRGDLVARERIAGVVNALKHYGCTASDSLLFMIAM
jgi:hypothetical protein